MLSENIKTLRTQKGMTQKGLADMLHVTAQAVSRWENGDVEPSVGTMKEMSTIFGVSIDDLISEDFAAKQAEKSAMKQAAATEADEPECENDVDEREDGADDAKETSTKKSSESGPVLAVCESCNRPIYVASEIVRSTNYYGRSAQKTVKCTQCVKKEATARYNSAVNYSKGQRTKSFIWGSVATIAALIVSIVVCTYNNLSSGYLIGSIVASVLLFPFVSCMMLKNNFVPDMVEGVYMFGFVKFPGLIFTLDLDGIIWLLTVKLLFWILGFTIAALFGVLAIALGLIVSPFVYPFALKKSFVRPEETEI